MVYESDTTFMIVKFGLDNAGHIVMTDDERRCWNVIFENVQDRHCRIRRITMKANP